VIAVNFLAETFPFEARIAAPPQIALDRIGVIILAGGEGKRLEPLTKSRCKPVLTFGGRYSLIDVPISYAFSSGLKKIYVLGQYCANSLQRHIYQTYSHNGPTQLEVNMLAPEEREGKKIWYKGTADAIRQNLSYFSELPSLDYFLILSGDQLYNIDFQEMIRFAIASDASMVLAAQPISEKEAKRMGVLKIQPSGTQLIDFYEKPHEKKLIDQYQIDDLTLHRLGNHIQNEKKHLGSMGIYLFKRQALFQLLQQEVGDDFGKHLIKAQMHRGNTHVFLYDGYWEDIGTIESYYQANLALTHELGDRKVGFQCYDEKSPIFTKARYLPNAKIKHTLLNNAIVCEGSIIEAKEIHNSIIGLRSRIKQGTIIRDSLLLGNEFYERPSLVVAEEIDKPGIGENCLIIKTIIDENVSIGNDVQLINKWGHINYDSPDGIFVRDGIIVVPRGTKLPDRFIF